MSSTQILSEVFACSFTYGSGLLLPSDTGARVNLSTFYEKKKEMRRTSADQRGETGEGRGKRGGERRGRREGEKDRGRK